MQLVYDTRSFCQETVSAMLNHLETLLENFVANPDGNVGEARLLSCAEEKSLIDDWRPGSYSLDLCAHQLVEQQAKRTPEKTALEHAGNRTAYGEVNLRSNKLAHFLRGRGIAVGDLVAICLEPSAEAVIAILGILKAGAVFIPLDRSLPQERLAAMLEDAAPSCLLSCGPPVDSAGADLAPASPPPPGADWAVGYLSRLGIGCLGGLQRAGWAGPASPPPPGADWASVAWVDWASDVWGGLGRGGLGGPCITTAASGGLGIGCLGGFGIGCLGGFGRGGLGGPCITTAASGGLGIGCLGGFGIGCLGGLGRGGLGGPCITT